MPILFPAPNPKFELERIHFKFSYLDSNKSLNAWLFEFSTTIIGMFWLIDLMHASITSSLLKVKITIDKFCLDIDIV